MSGDRSDALTRALFDFDGKRLEPLERFASEYPVDSRLIAQLCAFAESDDRNQRDAATWLLKRHRVSGAQLSPSQRESLLRLLLDYSGWLAQIHILQMLEGFVVPEELAESLMQALTRRATGANTFMRAWSVHGAAVLANQHPAYRQAALDLLDAAEQDQAASVRARLRRTRQAFDWC